MSQIQGSQFPSTLEAALAASFPQNFLWGAATASYQIEGATHQDGRSLSIWDEFAATPGKTYQGETGDVAADHYHLWPQDVASMTELHLNAYRFSIAWPRILPEGRGDVNTRGLDFYDRLVDALLAKGISPFATLYHWDLPLALQHEGGWVNRDTAYAFADYVEVVAKRLGDRITAWTTHNEPWCVAYLGYGVGAHAPGIRNKQVAVNAAHHVLLSHGLAVPRLRTHSAPASEVGITLNFTPIYAADDRPETMRDVARADAFNNRWFLDPVIRGNYPTNFFAELGTELPAVQDGDLATIAVPIDFLGVNNYSRAVVLGQTTPLPADMCVHVAPVPSACYTEMAWEIHPQSFADLLLRLHREYDIAKLYVTENGAAFVDSWNGGERVSDPRRVAYLCDYIGATAHAVAQGAPVRGYFVWSLLDNYEWAFGYSKRFGIIYVDYPSQRRIIKDSGRWYANLIAAYQQRWRQ